MFFTRAFHCTKAFLPRYLQLGRNLDKVLQQVKVAPSDPILWVLFPLQCNNPVKQLHKLQDDMMPEPLSHPTTTVWMTWAQIGR